MLVDWVYTHPAWLVGSVGVVAAVLLSSAGLGCTWLLVPTHFRREHNDVVGFTLAIVGVVYAVLLAFIAVVTWETFSRAGDLADNEVSHLANLYSDTSVLHGDTIDRLHQKLREYAHIVIEEEWPAQQSGHAARDVYRRGWYVLREANQALLSYKPADMGDSDVYRSALGELNALLAARRTRVEAVNGHVPELVWWIIVLGGALTVAYTFLFGVPSRTMHLVTTAGIAASLALIIVLIIELDYPFRGDISVSDEPYVRAHHQMTAEAAPP